MNRREVLALLLTAPVLAKPKNAPPPEVAAAQAGQRQGQVITMVGTVAEVYHSPQGHIFLNFGGAWPKMQFTAIVFKNEVKLFPTIDSLKGRTVAIRGKVKSYKGRPNLQLYSPTQLTLR